MNKNNNDENENVSFKYSGELVRFRLGTLVLIGFCILLIIISTFTDLSIIDVFSLDKGSVQTGFLLSDYVENAAHYSYIPQLPAIFFTIALLDRKYGITAIILYILLGLFVFPVFAMGGGINYISEYGFGYILAYIPGAFITAVIIKNNFHFVNVLKAVIPGVLVIHLIGVMYVIFISTLFNTSSGMVTGWITSQSGIKILYDIFFCILAVYIAKFIKNKIWLIMC